MKKYLFIFIIIFSVNRIYSQYCIVNDCKETFKLKKSTLYVVMNSKQDPNSEYEEVLKEYWKICPYKIINASEMFDYFSENSFFMTPSSNGNLKLWTPKRDLVSYIKRKHIKVENYTLVETNLIIIATFGYNRTQIAVDKVFNEDFTGKGYTVLNGAGIFKNYIQYIQNCIKNDKINKPLDSYSNSNELKYLKKSTLYILDYLVKKDEKTGERDISRIAEVYPYKFELISVEKLNEKIKTSEEPVYYFIDFFTEGHVFGNRDVANIINSNSGEIIFSDNVAASSYYISLGLVKNLKNEIENTVLMNKAIK